MTSTTTELAPSIAAHTRSHADEQKPSPLRVLIVSPSMRMVGGQAQQSDRLRRHLSTTGKVDAAHVAIDPLLPRYIQPLLRVRYLRTVVNELGYLRDLLVAVPRADVVHVFSAAYWAFLLHTVPALIVSRLFGKPAILNYRSGEAEDHLANWRTALPPIRRLTSAVVAPSGYLVHVFAQFGVRARSIVNFIEIDRFRFRVREHVRPRFVTNRLIEPLYNYPCLLRAFGMVQEKYPDASLVVASEGPERAATEALTEQLGLRNVSFVGRVSAARMAEVYDEADIYLTSPNVDCMPGSLLECAASGLPVVATRAGGIPYIVEHERTALLVPLDDSAAMAQMSLRLLEEPGLAARLGRAARADVEKRYVWPVVAEAWLTLYQQLAARKRAA
jgi:L-malate glycosyltransferase